MTMARGETNTESPKIQKIAKSFSRYIGKKTKSLNNSKDAQLSTRGENNLLSLYYTDSDPTEGEAKPVGLFGLLDIKFTPDRAETTSENLSFICENQRFFNQHQTLKELFPYFPTKMLKALIIRFSGNFKEITNHLIEKGWEVENPNLLSQIADKSDSHFSTPYFMGSIANSIVLDNAPNFTYYTCYRMDKSNINYYVVYKDQLGNVVRERISGPVIDFHDFPFLKQHLQCQRDLFSPLFFPLLQFI